MNNKGFTLIEILVTIALLSIFIITIPRVFILSSKNIINTDEKKVITVNCQNIIEKIKCLDTMDINALNYTFLDNGLVFKLNDKGYIVSETYFKNKYKIRISINKHHYYDIQQIHKQGIIENNYDIIISSMINNRIKIKFNNKILFSPNKTFETYLYDNILPITINNLNKSVGKIKLGDISVTIHLNKLNDKIKIFYNIQNLKITSNSNLIDYKYKNVSSTVIDLNKTFKTDLYKIIIEVYYKNKRIELINSSFLTDDSD